MFRLQLSRRSKAPHPFCTPYGRNSPNLSGVRLGICAKTDSHSFLSAYGSRLGSPLGVCDCGHIYEREAHSFSSATGLCCVCTYLPLEEYREGGSDMSQSTILYNILHYLFRISSKTFPYACQGDFLIARHIRRQFEIDPAPAAKLQDLAEEYSVSQSFLTHSFKKAIGYSLGRYQMLCRLAKAKELLQTTQLPVSDICCGCGFTDLSNFSRYFRREEGCAPSAYRTRQLPECID